MIIQNLLDKCRRSKPNAGISRFYNLSHDFVIGAGDNWTVKEHIDRGMIIRRVIANCIVTDTWTLTKFSCAGTDLLAGSGYHDLAFLWNNGQGITTSPIIIPSNSRIEISMQYSGRIPLEYRPGQTYRIVLGLFGTERLV